MIDRVRPLLIALAPLLLLAAAGSPGRPATPLTIPLPARDTYRFIVTGDAGTGDPHLHNGILALMKRVPVDAILLAGDNVYPCGVQSVDDPEWRKVTVNFADAGIPIYPVLGNHDYGDPTREGEAFKICGNPSPQSQVRATGTIPHWIFPARTYTLSSPIVDIFMIDTQPIASAWKEPFLGSETAASEVALLQNALNGSRAHWRMVIGHHTIYSSGLRGRAIHTEEKNLRSMLLPVLLENRVNAYVCGHDHDAELIGTLHRRSGEPLFLVAGDGAASLPMEERTKTDEPPTIFPTAFPPKPLVGFTLMEISKHKMSITFYDGIGNKRSDTYVMLDR